MKLLITLIGGCITFLPNSFGQNKSFEGYVKYRTIRSYIIQLNDQQKKYIDTSYSTVYYKKGDYLDQSSNLFENNTKQVFLNDSCKIYYIPLDKKEPITVFLGTSQDSTITVEPIFDKKAILNFTCEGFNYTSKYSSYTIYYSTEHFIKGYNSNDCDHRKNYYNEDRIPLYVALESIDNETTLQTIALEIESTHVSRRLFKLPKHRKYIHESP